MSYYPILLDLSGKKAIVVGGGMVAQRKIETLIESGALIHVIAHELTSELQSRLEKGEIKLLAREFDEGHIEDAFLIIAATDNRVLNQRISRIAKNKNILINAVDQPLDCNFIFPSIVRRGDLLIAVSTSGKSPAMAKRIGERLSGQFGREYEAFLIIMGNIRRGLLSENLSGEDRNRIFNELVDSTILDSIKRDDLVDIASCLERILKRPVSHDDVINLLKDE